MDIFKVESTNRNAKFAPAFFDNYDKAFEYARECKYRDYQYEYEVTKFDNEENHIDLNRVLCVVFKIVSIDWENYKYNTTSLSKEFFTYKKRFLFAKIFTTFVLDKREKENKNKNENVMYDSGAYYVFTEFDSKDKMRKRVKEIISDYFNTDNFNIELEF